LAYWEIKQQLYNDELRRYAESPKRLAFLANYTAFTRSAYLGTSMLKGSPAAEKLRYHLPVLIHQRVAAVRALGHLMASTAPADLHRLRVRFKELRYTLQFFAPLLSEKAMPFIDITRQLQEHLGYLNDTSVALMLLEETPDCEAEVATYRAYQQMECSRLMGALPPLWATFDDEVNHGFFEKAFW
jgi:CHAD domain-containing protein